VPHCPVRKIPASIEDFSGGAPGCPSWWRTGFGPSGKARARTAPPCSVELLPAGRRNSRRISRGSPEAAALARGLVPAPPAADRAGRLPRSNHLDAVGRASWLASPPRGSSGTNGDHEMGEYVGVTVASPRNQIEARRRTRRAFLFWAEKSSLRDGCLSGECGISERSGHSFDCSEYNPATRTSLQQALDLFVKSFFESLGNTNSSAQYNYSHRRRIAVVCVQPRNCRELAIHL